MRRILFAMLSCTAANAGVAYAQEQPVLAPTRDVAVTYRVIGPTAMSGAAVVKMTYGDHDRKVRLDFFAFPDAKVPFGSLIFDEPDEQVFSLLRANNTYYKESAIGRANPGLMLGAMMQYKSLGDATIAGLQCTDWHVSQGTTDKGTACVTADGVVLRGMHTKPQPGGLEATAVVYGKPPDSVFRPDPTMVQGRTQQPGLPARPTK